MFGGDKTCISRLFVKHCEQTDHHPAMQQHLEKLEAIEVLHCAGNSDIGSWQYYVTKIRQRNLISFVSNL